MSPPLRFRPSLHARVWGGRRLEEQLGRELPPDEVIGESWELVDREEEQSVVAGGPHDGTTLGALWSGAERERLFGAGARGERFPLLVKLLDATSTLSVQVHPPQAKADELGGEPKTEMWVLLACEPGAHLFVGLRAGVDRAQFEAVLQDGGDVSALLHRVDVAPGDAMFLPSGRVHAIGAGCLVLEVQQNSDTTYRVFDFNRPGLDGRLRELHVEPSLASIDFDDPEPALLPRDAEALVKAPELDVERWTLAAAEERRAAPAGACAVVCALAGGVRVGGVELAVGDCVLVPADASDAEAAVTGPGVVLRCGLPTG